MAHTYLSDEDLRKKLKEYGIQAGPINHSTRTIYEKKLRSLLQERKRDNEADSNVEPEPKKPRYGGNGNKKQPKKSKVIKTPNSARNRAISGTLRKNDCSKEKRRGKPVASMEATIVADTGDPSVLYPRRANNELSDTDLTIGEDTRPQAASPGSASFKFPKVDTDSIQNAVKKGLGFVKDLVGLGKSPSRAAVGSAKLEPVAKSASLTALKQEIRQDMFRQSPEAMDLMEKPVSDLPSSSRKPSGEKYDWELQPGDVHVCRRQDGSLWSLGKGGFGVVYKGIMGGVDEVAVKVVHVNSPILIQQLKQEIDMISKMRHKHILQFYGACVDPSTVYMVTELMQRDLFSALRSMPNQYKWSGVYGPQVSIGIASGIHYLHTRRPPVVHRDIKSPNILLTDSLAKIADVGLARTKAESDMTAQKGFTVAWAAPEVVYRRRATEKIDIWSFGIILWEIVTGQLPRSGHLSLPYSAPPSVRQIYQACTMDDATQRPNSLELVVSLKSCAEQP